MRQTRMQRWAVAHGEEYVASYKFHQPRWADPFAESYRVAWCAQSRLRAHATDGLRVRPACSCSAAEPASCRGVHRAARCRRRRHLAGTSARYRSRWCDGCWSVTPPRPSVSRSHSHVVRTGTNCTSSAGLDFALARRCLGWLLPMRGEKRRRKANENATPIPGADNPAHAIATFAAGLGGRHRGMVLPDQLGVPGARPRGGERLGRRAQPLDLRAAAAAGRRMRAPSLPQPMACCRPRARPG